MIRSICNGRLIGRRGVLAAAIACSANALAGGTTLNDPLIWDNGPPTGGGGSSQLATSYPFDSQVADDFTLRDQNPGGPDSYVVTGVQWNGVYWNGDGNIAHGFNVNFFADDGGVPTGSGPLDPTDTALLHLFIPLADVNEMPNGFGERTFSYDAKLPLPFLAETDTVYWLGVQARMEFAPQWGYSANEDVKGFEGVQGFPLLGINYWQPQGNDYSFSLTGVPIPEPGMTAAWVMAAMGVAWRHRRQG